MPETPAIEIQTAATIETVKQILDFQNYPSQLQALKPGAKQQQLLIGPRFYLQGPGNFDHTRGLVLSLMFMNDVLSLLGQPQPKHTDILQFTLTVPFLTVSAEWRADALELLEAFNIMMPLGTLLVNEKQVLEYRYGWRIYQREVDGLVLLEALDLIYLYLDQLLFRLEELLTGQKSLQTLLQEEIQFQD